MSLLPQHPTKRMMMNEAVPTLFDKTPSNLVGKPINRVDGPLKVSGQATYSAEFHMDNMAYGVLVGATVAKGKVKDIDSSALDNIDGIIKIVTDPKKFIRHSQQGGKMKSPTQGTNEVTYYGQPIAAVIAETFEAATEGANAIKVTFEDETDDAVLNFDAALDEAHDIDDSAGMDKSSKQGDPEKGLAEAAVSFDKVYTTPSQSNSPMEPHATIAHWEGDKLILHTSNQMLAPCKQQVSDALDLDGDNVQLISKFVGGGFGSKLGIAPESIAAALASKELERPVRIVMTRPQVMEATVRRSNTRQRIAIGCDENGEINTVIHETICSNLADAKFYEPAGLATHFLYKGENRLVDYQMVDVNWVLSGSMRAPGEAVGQIAFECAMDELAETLTLDPIEFRRRNEPDEDPSQNTPFSSRKLLSCIDTGAKEFGWEARKPKPASNLQGDWWIGHGMAAAARVNNLAPSEARATLMLDSTKTYGVKAVIETDMTDIGTGSYTVFTQVVADLLGLPIDHIEMVLGDTDLPPASGSGGSVGAASSGSSIYLACSELREQIAQMVGLYPDTIQFEAGHIAKAGTHDKSVTETTLEKARDKTKDFASNLKDKIKDKADLSDEITDNVASKASDVAQNISTLANKAMSAVKERVPEGMADSLKQNVTDNIKTVKDTIDANLPKPSIPKDTDAYNFENFNTYPLADIIKQSDDKQLVAVGQIAPGTNAKNYRQASYGANFVEVAVHRVTGEVRLKRMTGVFEAGRILNRKTATSQCYGGMVFGIGSALMEQIIHDEHDGRLCNHDLAEYHVPVNADVPQLDVILLEADDPYTNPMHIKGIGETAISGAAAAIANAVYNAVGVRIYDFPITMDKILDGLP